MSGLDTINGLIQGHGGQNTGGSSPYGLQVAKYQNQQDAIAVQRTSVDKNIGQPSNSWLRLAQQGAGMVANFLGGIVKGAVEDIGNTATGIARELTGSADIEAINKQNQQESKQVSDIAKAVREGRMSRQDAQKYFQNTSKSDNQQYSANQKFLSFVPSQKQFTGNVINTALNVVPIGAGGSAIKGAKIIGETILKNVGEQGVKNLAVKAGIDVSGKAAVDVAKEVAGTQVGKQAFKQLTKQSLVKSASKNIAAGAGFGGVQGAASEYGSGGNAKQILKSGLKGAAIGAGIGAAGELVAKGASKLLEKSRGGRVDIGNVKEVASKHQAAEKMANERGLPQGETTKGLPQGKINTQKQLPAGSKQPISGKGFTIVPPEKANTAKVVNNRISQIDKLVSAAQKSGTTKSAAEMRTLMRERSSLLGVAAGKKSLKDIKSSIKESPAIAKLQSAAIEDRNVSKVTPNEKVSGGATKLEARAVQQGLAKEFENKATYTPQSFKKNAEDAVNLVKDNPKKAMDIATGKIPGNNTIHESAVFHAVKEQAIKEGDVNTIQRLASSEHYTKTSEAAQKLGMESYNAVSHDPVKAIQEVRNARQAAFEKNSKTTVAEETSKAMKTVKVATKAPSKNDWASLIEQLRCK